MSSDGRQWVCAASGTQLRDFDQDGARCSISLHWHPRCGSGFVGATAVAGPVTYEVIEPPEARELAPAGGADGTR